MLYALKRPFYNNLEHLEKTYNVFENLLGELSSIWKCS